MKQAGGLCWLLLFFGCSAPASPEAVIRDFVFPWAEKTAPPTEFQARTDGEQLHFTFTVEDADIVVSDAWSGESTLDGEDRVEIFFAGDAELKNYWCIEIDPKGRVHDYHARHYRQFDSDWNCPGLLAEGARTASGYVVRGSVPLETLSKLCGKRQVRGSTIFVGLFRAEFYGTSEETHGAASDNWISWVRPKTKEPDFHTPSAFRLWRLP